MLEDTFVQGLLIQNYYDRSDINGGFDVGFKVHPKLEPYVGYRLGHQDQEFRAVPPYAPTAPSYSYANQYQRFFVGASITPSSRVILSGEIGPSLHFFDRSTIQPQDAGHAERDYLYFLVNGTFQLASNTTLKVTGNQHLLPASAGNAVFQWPSAAGTLGHRFSSQWRGQFRFAYTEYDFDGGITRRDQVYVAEATVRYSVNRHMDIEAFDAYEWGANVLDIPNGSKRDYDRNLVGVRLRASY
jgi:hypothetical protein